MTSLFLIVFIVVDVIIVGALVFLAKRQASDSASIMELTEERQAINELRTSIQEELRHASTENKEIIKRVSHLAVEVEQEVKSGSGNLKKELEGITTDLAKNFENPMKDLAKKTIVLEGLLRKVEREKIILLKILDRGEKIAKFFNEKIPYEDILSELEDKKYQDARHLLAKGIRPEKIATDLNMSLSEIRLIAGMT